MQSIIKPSIFLLLIGLVYFPSCKKEYSCERCNVANSPPVADAGADTTLILPTDSTKLNGSNSTDPDKNISAYLWTKIAGPASFVIGNANAVQTKVNKLIKGVYRFELKVTDKGGLFSKDTMQIIVRDTSVSNKPPVANAGPDQSIVLPTNNVTLDGSASYDPDNNIINYSWTKISGPSSFTILNATAVQTQLNNLEQGIYQFELKVTDAGGLFSKDTVKITVNPQTPNSDCAVNRPIVNAQLIPIGTLSQARSGVVAAAAGNKILFAGGGYFGLDGCSEASSRVDIYDVVTQSWSTAELTFPRWYITAVTSGSKIFFAGGYSNCSNYYPDSFAVVNIYDASTNAWSTAQLSEPRMGLAGAAVGDKVLFGGGFKIFSNPQFSDVVDIYNNSTNTWSTSALSERRSNLSALAAGSKIYFAGGSDVAGSWWSITGASNRIDIFNSITNSWTTSSFTPLMGSKDWLSGIAVANKIYWAGGGSNNIFENNASAQVEIRDINTSASSLSCLFQSNKWSSNAAVLKDNKIIFFTGTGAETNKFDIYDISNNTWSIGLLNQPVGASAIISLNNTIYVKGGNNTEGGIQVWRLEF